MTAGRGILLRDAAGKDHIDASGGRGLLSWGSTCVMCGQLDRLEYAHTSFFTHTVAESADDSVGHAPPGSIYVLFVSSGSEAVEPAVEAGTANILWNVASRRGLFVARQQSHHASALGALAVGGRELIAQTVRAFDGQSASCFTCLRIPWPPARTETPKCTAECLAAESQRPRYTSSAGAMSLRLWPRQLVRPW